MLHPSQIGNARSRRPPEAVHRLPGTCLFLSAHSERRAAHEPAPDHRPGGVRRGRLHRTRKRPVQVALRVLPGGGPANTAVALARLGTPARFLARLSGDVFGRLPGRSRGIQGVDLSYAVAAAEPGALAVAELDAEGQAAFSFHAQATADWQWTSAELVGVDLADTACVHQLAGPGRGAEPERPCWRTSWLSPHLGPRSASTPLPARSWCTPRSTAPGWRTASYAGCTAAERGDDLQLLLPGTPPEQACDIWHAAGARLVVITRGADGALASLDGERVQVPAISTRVADTVGAGDSFTAGLLHHLGARGLLGGRLTELRLDDVEEACASAPASRL